MIRMTNTQPNPREGKLKADVAAHIKMLIRIVHQRS